MQELFLTTFVKDGADFERASAVLHGLTNMSGWEGAHRVLFFAGPLPPKGFAVTRSMGPAAKLPQQNALWSGLNQAMMKMSFILQLRYEVFKDRDFGSAGENGGEVPPSDVVAPEVTETELNKTSGTLRWTDIPKPTENQPMIQRKRIEITDHKNLVAILKDNNHRFKSEAIEESVSYFIDNIEFTLVRYYVLPAAASDPTGAGAGSQPLHRLPPWSSLRLLDPSGAWTLFVRTTVPEDNAPDKVKKAAEALHAVRDQLAGVFDFKIVDRRAHDTRILQSAKSFAPPPMPQTQRVRG